ncbi:MAG: flgG 1 [Pedosphaera sp.]|nr:flgG 1 [Pedosphaera sp.]
MLSSLTSGVSGLENFQQEMDVIGNNIANINTTGYKAATVNFADAFSNTLRSPSGGSSTTSGADSVQVGTGVTITGINNNWSQGALSADGVASNLAVSGNGFFMVRDTVTNTDYATRAGAFTVDPQGYLVTDTGERVQGYSDAGLSTLGDIKIDNTGAPTAGLGVTGYSIDGQGKVNVKLSDGSSFVRGQVLMQNFAAPQNLTNEGNNLYSNMAAAGGLSTISAAGTNGLGTIQSGAVELSNVDLSGEMANLITAQRAFEANSKIITASNEVLQTVVNMIR